MSNELDSIHEKLDRIQADVHEIKVLDAVQNEQLKAHMKRSDLLEDRVEQVNNELKPVLDHVIVVKGLFKVVGGVGFMLGIIEALRRLL